MTLNRSRSTRRAFGLLGAGLLTLSVQAQAQAQTPWTPTQPITILVGFAPGGSADQIARQLASASKGIIPVPVIVHNRPGAAGAIAAQAAAEARPDGYTLFVGGGSETTSVGNFKSLPYDPRKSFTAVIKVSRAPSLLAVRGESRFADMKSLLAEARQGAEKVSYASTGEGGIFHATGTVWEKLAGIKLLHVPYKGAADSMLALMGGQVDSAFGAYEEMKPMIEAGKVRPLAVFSRSRLPALPNVPTMTELGRAGRTRQHEGADGAGGVAAAGAGLPARCVPEGDADRRVEGLRRPVRADAGLCRRSGVPEGDRRGL